MVQYVGKLCIIIIAALPIYILFRIVWIKGSAERCRRAGRAEGAGRFAEGEMREEAAGSKKAGMPEGTAMARKLTIVRELAMGCFILFHIGLLLLVLEGEYGSPIQMAERAAEKIMTGTGINLVPFRTITSFFVHFNLDIFLVNIVGNVIMFMPWGFGIVLLWKRNQNIWSVVGYSLLLPFFIETSQLFIGRSVDVDDLLLNFVGGCLGAGSYFLVKKKCGFLCFLSS